MLSPSDPRVGVSVNLPTWVGSLQTSCSGDLNPIQSLTPPSPPFSLFALLRSRFPRLKVSHAVRLLCSCCCRHSSKPARLAHATMCEQLRRIYSTDIQSKKENSKGTAPRKKDYTGTATANERTTRAAFSFRVMSSGEASRRSLVP